MSDAWDDINELRIREYVTQVKLTGSEGSILQGFTKPEGWPFFLLVAVGPSAPNALQIFEEILAKLRSGGTQVHASQNPKLCPHCGAKR